MRSSCRASAAAPTSKARFTAPRMARDYLAIYDGWRRASAGAPSAGSARAADAAWPDEPPLGTGAEIA